MPRLQELIIRLGCVTVGDINRAIFAHPDAGLLESLEQTIGFERAAEIRTKIAQAVDVPLISDKEVQIDGAVLSVSAMELSPLVTKYKALPLRFAVEDENKMLILAASDPLIEEAKTAFSALYGLPVRLVFARERAIMDAYALASAKLALRARKEAAEHPDQSLPNVAKHLEDPEVRRALQQVVATAVKHTASEVLIGLHQPFTHANFTFGDGLHSSVDISVQPFAFLESLIRRGQILTVDDEHVTGACRIRFKSVSVNFSMECERDLTRAETGESGEADGTLRLYNFVLDDSENPVFWKSISERNDAELRDVLGQSHGILFICGAKQAAREFAVRSLAESYSDMSIVELAGKISEKPEIFQAAENNRVLVSVPAADVFDVLKQLADIPSEQKALVRGIFSYVQMPRNCCFCSAPAVPETALLLQVPPYVNLPAKEFRSGKGCAVCHEKGWLGFFGVASVLNLAGSAGQVFRDGGGYGAVVQALAEDSFSSLLEEGVLAAAAGKTKLSIVFDEMPKVPQEYTKARGFSEDPPKEAPVLKKESAAPLSQSLRQVLQLEDEPPPPNNASGIRKFPGDEPLRGREVFLAAMREKNGGPPADKKDDSDWLFPKTPPETIKKTPEKPAAQAEARSLVLVIDDDADQRAILRRVFEIAGYQVEVAADGIDGIVSAVRLVPQLIIVDFMMPELDGRETIRRLKQGQATGAIPVVALTAYADPDVELGLLQAGADDFCPKSVSKQVLLKRVERLMRARD